MTSHARLAIGILLTAIAASYTDGSPLQLISDVSQLIAVAGANVTFACVATGEGYKYFYNQIIWHKVLASGEEMQINTGAIINQPFAATGRYVVEPEIAQEYTQVVSMQLVLRELTLGDNGTYRCDLMGRQGIMDSITHSLLVTAPVQSVHLHINRANNHQRRRNNDDTLQPTNEEMTRDFTTPAVVDHNDADMTSAGEEETNDVNDNDVIAARTHYDDGEELIDDINDNSNDNVEVVFGGDSYSKRRSIVIREYDHVTVACSSVGGHPTPQLSVVMGNVNITHQFTRYESVTYAGGRGFEVATPTVRLVQTGARPGFDWSGLTVSCLATVPHAPEFAASSDIELRVLYEPKFLCDCDRPRGITVQPHSYSMECLVKANPPINPADIQWSLGTSATNNVSLSVGQNRLGFSVTAVQQRDPEAILTTLTMVTVNDAVFQTYVIRASNNLGAKTCSFNLLRIADAVDRNQGDHGQGHKPAQQHPLANRNSGHRVNFPADAEKSSLSSGSIKMGLTTASLICSLMTLLAHKLSA